MIYSLRGKLISVDSSYAVIECSGVGFLCCASYKTLASLPEIGQEVMLYTYMSIRENAMDLYGFYDKSELDFFKLIIEVSGVGPKIGIGILSDFTPEQLAGFIVSGDTKSISKATGVGMKLAQRIALELKDKVAKGGYAQSDAPFVPVSKPSGNISEAIDALVSLGFTQADAQKATSSCSPDDSVENIIKTALKSVSN